ncbi:unnamed protein product [Rotaria sp. Silwood2]|nr:unnamed protein product [Rotaria sp. Silwood2]
MTHNIPDNRDLSCYHVTKHSWRGKYKRIFSIGTHGISTYEPSTLGLTNAWSYDQVVSLTLSKSSNISDKSQQTLSNSSPIAEFILTFRTKSKKNDTMRFSSEYRSDIITDALRFQTLFYHQQQSLNQPKIIQATKIHWSSQRTPVLLRIQSYCIEQIDATTNRYLCSYEYKDIEQLIPLTSEGDTTVRGFLIQDKYNARLHAFVTTETSTLFQNIIDLAHTNLGVQIRLSKKSYTLNDYSQLRFGPTYVSDEHLTSFAEFIVYKHSSRHADHVRRLLCLTETCLIERDPATYHICTLKPLNEIFGLVRHKDSLQEFTIEYIRNNPTRSKCKYTSTERDILLATLLDSVRSAGNNDCCVKTNLTDRGKRFSPFGHLVDDEVEIQHLKFLVQPPSGRLSSPQDSNNPSTSQGGVSFNEILKRFNANVPYSGLINAVSSEGLFAENREKLIHSALNTLLDTDTTNNVVDLEFIEDQYLAFRRLLASKAGFQAFTQLPKFRERIGTKIVRSLKLNDDQITYSALEVLNTLLQPMHLDYDLRQEQLNKSSILSTKKFLENLLDIFLKHVKQNTGSLIISSFLDFLTYTLCPPFSETTDGQHFDVLLELVSSNGRIFFKLFQHSSFTIVKGAGSIMKAIIEEGSSDIAAHMQDLALSEGALPVHLLRALFTASNDTRLVPLKYLSQQLLGLWSTGHPTTYGLLKRIFPLGLIAYLDSSEEPDKDFDSHLWVQFIYYALFIIIFQFGWACSQITHLAMINDLTHKDGERVALNSYRFAWTFISNIIVYTTASILLGFSSSHSESTITSADAPTFRTLTLIVIGVGLICMIIFHVVLKESKQITEETENCSVLLSTSSRRLKRMTWKSFLCEKEFYQCTVIWMCARVIFNITQTFLPLYTIDTIVTLNRIFVAIAPLCIYLSGLFASFPMRAINKRIGRNLTNNIGYGFTLVSMILFWFIFDLKSKVQIEIALISACVLLGIGTSTSSICSSALASDLIGLNTECGAFVYGIMSLTDKLTNGIIIVIIQQFNPCKLSSTRTCALYYRYIITFIPTGVSILAILMILSIWKTKIGTNRYEIIEEKQNDTEIKVAQKNEYNERSPLVD